MSQLPPPADVCRTRNRRSSARLGLAVTSLVVAGVAVAGMAPAHAAEARIDLGTAEAFSVIAGSTVTNTGPSIISNDLGVTPGSAVTGFPPGVVLGAVHAADAVANTAQTHLTTAYDDAAGRSSTGAIAADLAGRTLTTGVYTSATSLGLTGTLTLDAQGDPNAVFIFQAGSTLTTGSNSTVALVNGASPCNVFWQVGSSATLGTGTQFVGTVMALTSAALGTGANVNGRILARNGAVTLDTNVITSPSCAVPAPTTPPSTAVPTTSPTPTPTPTAAPTSPPGSPTGTPAAPAPSSTPPVVPLGHPPTGLGGAEQQRGGSSTLLLILAGMAAAGALVAPRLAKRSSRRG